MTAESASTPLRVEIVSIGEELLSGDSDIIDTNSIYITKQFASIGLRVFYKTTVGDDEQRITDVLKLALSRADIVLTSGGLGPTVDDMTRQGVANATGRGLEFHQSLMDEIATKFARFGSRMSENNRIQAMLPERGIVIPNPVGTAPGFIVEHEGKVILSVPGVPREMKYLMEHTILPYLREKFNLTGIIKLRVLRTAGIGESLVDEKIGDLEKLVNPTVGLAAHSGQVDVRIYGRAQTEAEADKLIEGVETEVRQRLGSFIYGVDKEPLEGAFVTALKEAGTRVALVEVGTGGAFRKRIENHPEGALVIASAELAETIAQVIGPADPTEYRAKAEQVAIRLREQHQAGLGIAILSDEHGTAIAITDGKETRGRTYGYGGAAAGTYEWFSGWAMSMSWHLLVSVRNGQR